MHTCVFPSVLGIILHMHCEGAQCQFIELSFGLTFASPPGFYQGADPSSSIVKATGDCRALLSGQSSPPGRNSFCADVANLMLTLLDFGLGPETQEVTFDPPW